MFKKKPSEKFLWRKGLHRRPKRISLNASLKKLRRNALKIIEEVLEIVGDIAGNFIAERADSVDKEGAHFNDGVVTYAKGTKENLERLKLADLLGMNLPREYGGLNLPFTIYLMSTLNLFHKQMHLL